MKNALVMMVGLTVLATGCNPTGGDPREGQPGEAGRRGSRTIEITGKEYSFDVPSTIRGGFVEVDFRNRGKLKHEAAFFKLDPQAPRDQFINDLRVAEKDEGPIAQYIKPYVLSTKARPGKGYTARLSLPAGSYYLVCTLSDADSRKQKEDGQGGEDLALPSHYEQGMIKQVTVTGPSKVAFPKSEAVITGKDYSFDVAGLKTGNNEILFRNDGPAEIHMAAVLEFPKGVDEAKARETFSAFVSGEQPPPGTPEPKDVAFGGLFEPGGGSIFFANFKKGRVYALACFTHDRAGGPSHVAKGMLEIIKLR